MKNLTFLFISILALAGRFEYLYAQQDTLPLAPDRFTSINTTEGTFMNLDVSPKDGSIVFELLGNIFLLPKQGGVPKQLTYGISWDSYPIFSPNGDSIAFISDRTGSRDIFTMNTDGSNLKKVESNADFYLDAIYWLDQPRNTAPIIEFEYQANKIPVIISNQDLLHIDHSENIAYYKTDTGVEALNIISGIENHLTNSIDFKNKNIAISPDGNFLALVTKYDIHSKENKTNVLSIINLRSSKVIVTKKVGSFLQYIPRFAFSEDSKSLVLAYSGKIHRIQLANGKDNIIPFKATINLALAPYVYNTFKYNLDENVRHFRWYTPIDSMSIFSSLGTLYKQVGRTIAPVNSSLNHGQFYPSLSDDHSFLLYSSWNKKGEGFIWNSKFNGEQPKKIIEKSGLYKNPIWIKDTTRIAYISGNRNYERYAEARELGKLMTHDLLKKKSEILMDSIPFSNSLIFNTEKCKLLFLGRFKGKERYSPLYSYDLNSKVKKEFARVQSNVSQIAISPNQDYLAFIYNNHLYLVCLKNASPPYDLVLETTDLPVKRISKYGALDPIFSGESQLGWIWSDKYYSVVIGESFDIPKIQETQLKLSLRSAKFNIPEIFTGARIITMKGKEVIDNGTLIVENGKIKNVKPSDQLLPPERAKVISLNGKTIIPGYIDMHGHDGPPEDILSLYWPRYVINLAYGITSQRDPSTYKDYQAYAALSEKNKILAPRIFGADALVTGTFEIESYQDALSWVRMQKSLGAIYIKVHDSWNRKQRQWLVKAARHEHLNIIGHAYNRLYSGIYNLSILLDGFTGLEHTIPFDKLYKDVKDLMVYSKIFYTPTSVNSSGQYYTYKKGIRRNNQMDVNQALSTGLCDYLKSPDIDDFVPTDSMFKTYVDTMNDLHGAETKIMIGSHGDLPGIEFHWEMWSMIEGGLSPWEVLRSATILSAEGLGLQDYLGSLEPGKMADFVILNSNPLEEKKATLDIYGIVKGGHLYLQEDLLSLIQN